MVDVDAKRISSFNPWLHVVQIADQASYVGCSHVQGISTRKIGEDVLSVHYIQIALKSKADHHIFSNL